VHSRQHTQYIHRKNICAIQFYTVFKNVLIFMFIVCFPQVSRQSLPVAPCLLVLQGNPSTPTGAWNLVVLKIYFLNQWMNENRTLKQYAFLLSILKRENQEMNQYIFISINVENPRESKSSICFIQQRKRAIASLISLFFSSLILWKAHLGLIASN
jgi:hypothetical protein